MKQKFLGCHPLLILIAKKNVTLRFQFEKIKGCYFQLEISFLALEVCVL